MILYILLIIAISIFEIRLMAKKKFKKEIGLYIFFTVVALGLAWAYSSNPYKISIADYFLSLLRIKH